MSARPVIDQIALDAETHFQRCLAIWVDWMHANGTAPLRFSRTDSVFGQAPSNYMIAHDDSDVVYEAEDRKLASKVNACVEDLLPSERLAVYIDRGLARRWPFANLDMKPTLDLAMISLRRAIARKC